MTRGDLFRVLHPSGDSKKARVFVIVSRGDLVDSSFSTVICAPVYSERRGLSTAERGTSLNKIIVQKLS
jgi:mRNA interferase MazF